MEYLISAIIGYLLGSFPSAYILLKKTRGTDITKEGSGNVGAMNSFEVSKSTVIGVLVFVTDFFKGIASVIVPIVLFPNEFIYPALALIFAILSHCFNPWLQFKGGRGLATSAGGAAIIFPFMLAVWCVLWAIIYVIKKDILLANIAATIFSLLVLLGTSEIAIKYAMPHPENISVVVLLSSAVLILIFIKHIEPLKELISIQKTNRKLRK